VPDVGVWFQPHSWIGDYFRLCLAIGCLDDAMGSADLLNAFYQANHAGLLAGQLGATYFIPTVFVPILLITHALTFRILLQDERESLMSGQRA
jgi:hypothetical protein